MKFKATIASGRALKAANGEVRLKE